MKIKSTIATVGALTALASTALAGPAVDTTMVDVPPVIPPSEPDGLGFSLSTGYDSKYVFRGVDFGDNLVWVGLDYANDFGSPVEWSVGAWYASLADDDYSELDLYTALGFAAGPVDMSIGFIYYYYPREEDDSDNSRELYGSIGTALGPVDLELYTGYDFEPNGWYFALSGGWSYDFNSAIGIDLSAGVSYINDYFIPDSGWNNVDLRIALPISITETATLEPYIAGTISLEQIEDFQDDEVYGGIALSVDF